MKFIIPKNYNYHTKLLGIFDYPTAIFNIVFLLLLWFFFGIFIHSLTWHLSFVFIFYIPIFLISISNAYYESPVFQIYYILKFIIRPKLYLYFPF